MAGRKNNTHRPARTNAVAVAAAIAAALTLNASPARSADKSAAREAVVPIPVISVTATKNPIDAFEYPGMVSVIGGASMRNAQPSTPDDLMRYIPGVDFFGGPRRTGEVPSIRGFSGPDVIVLLDGARQNYISGHDGRFFIEPMFLRQIEVVKGSSSALYGSGGTGGVIELRTLQAADLIAPGARVGGQVSGGYQDVNGEWNAGLIGATRFGDNVELLGGATYRDSDDIRLGSGDMLPSDDDLVSGLIKGRAVVREFHEVEMSWQRYHDDTIEPNSGQAVGTDLTNKIIDSDNLRASYGFSDPANPWIDFDFVGYYVRSNLNETRLDSNGAGPAGELTERKLSTLGMRADNRTRMNFNDKSFTIFTYGVEAYRDEGEGRTNGGAASGIPNAESNFAGVFAQAQIEFEDVFGAGSGITLIPGLRYDSYASESNVASEISSDEVSPKFAVQVRPIRPLMLFGSYAKAFRAPNLNELFPTGTHFVIPGFGTNSFIANTALKPQTTQTYEVGAGLRGDSLLVDGDSGQIKAARYWIQGKDFIDTVVTQPGPPACFPPNCNGTTQSVNVADAELRGYEIEAKYDTPRYLIEAGFAHIDGENARTGAPLGVLTADKLTTHAALKLPESSLQIGWRHTYAAPFDNTADPALVRGAYHVDDIYAHWQASDGSALKGFGVTVGIDNLLDKEYARAASGASEPGRNVKATVRYSASW